MRGGDLYPADFSRLRMARCDYNAPVHLRRLGGQASRKEQIGFGVRAFDQDRQIPSNPCA